MSGRDDLALRAEAYDTVAALIGRLQACAAAPPSLERLAAQVGLSRFQLQRLFGQWVGISPKRFVQYLSKERALAALRETSDVLGAAIDSGLSGPGRLHDLLVTCEAVTPGEARQAGQGLSVRHGIAPTPFGQALVATTERGVCHVGFVDTGPGAALAALQARWPRARLVADPAQAAAVVQAMFGAADLRRPLHLWLRGTNFQIKVWEALLRVPAGALVSYGSLATAIGMPGAARAVGSALGANPLAVLIPCHRVIRDSGALGGYRWGLVRKQALLACEATARDAPSYGPKTGLTMT